MKKFIFTLICLMTVTGIIQAQEQLFSKVEVDPSQIYITTDALLVQIDDAVLPAQTISVENGSYYAMLELNQNHYSRCVYCGRLYLISCRTPGCPGNPNTR